MSPKHLFWLLPLATLASCGNASTNEQTDKSATAAVATRSASSEADSASQPLNSPLRKVIHTADFNCEVQNVFSATTKLEKLVTSVGGIVQDSRISNSNAETHTAYYTNDSLRQSQTFTTTATLTLRVPVPYLDSVIQAIPGMASFIDSRTLTQSDVTYKYLSNELKNKVGDEKATSTRAMQLAKKSKDPIDVQEYEKERQEQKIDRRIENMQLTDEVTYATITVAFAQPQQVFVQTIINPDYFIHPPFMLQCKAALENGWSFVRAAAIVLMNLWPVILLSVAGLVVYKKIRPGRIVLAKK